MEKELWLGLATGVIFGFLLQKGRVLRFDKQIAAMLFKDMTILKFMLSAIMVGSVGITLLSQQGIITLNHKPMNLGAVLIGGSLFGIGWGIMGFCPGTSIGAIAEGRLHAIFAVIGMIVGAAIYAELFPVFKTTILAWKDFGKIGLPEVLNVSPWVVVIAIWVISLGLFAWFEKKGI
ncbi:MAG: DUF6691 family protein [Thermodesulforhabdaceae bacterium]|jgi:uncharacterized membrane protein YedE/YeeE